MPAEETISELYKHHEHSFLKHLERARKLREKEVHHLRVEIKNLRVLFEFLKALPEEKFKTGPLLKLLNPVFKRAGKIRTHHLNSLMVGSNRNAIMRRFKEYLEKEEKKAGKNLIKEIKDFNSGKFNALHKKNLKALKKLESRIIEVESEKYMRSIFARLRITMFDMHQDEVLHEIRKNLKTIKIISNLLEEMNVGHALNKETKKIRGTYEKIGQWHDGVVLADEFEKYILKKEQPETHEEAIALVLKLKEKNEKNKILIAKKLKEDLL
jgi:CHAD domain-containing protein